MPATVTLSSTTLADGINDSATRISVASTSGLIPGLRLYIEGELLTVLRLDVDPWVFVTRGVDGTSSSAHSAGALAYIGRADQFYSGPPVGRPQNAIPVSPYIDVINGKVYFAQGDASATQSRWWQLQTSIPGTTSLGVRTTTLDPTVST